MERPDNTSHYEINLAHDEPDGKDFKGARITRTVHWGRVYLDRDTPEEVVIRKARELRDNMGLHVSITYWSTSGKTILL